MGMPPLVMEEQGLKDSSWKGREGVLGGPPGWTHTKPALVTD